MTGYDPNIRFAASHGASGAGPGTFYGNIALTGVYETSRPAQLNGTKWTFKTDGPIIGSYLYSFVPGSSGVVSSTFRQFLNLPASVITVVYLLALSYYDWDNSQASRYSD